MVKFKRELSYKGSNLFVIIILCETGICFSLCTGFSWDSEGDLLAIICQTPQVILWDANLFKKHTVDVGLKDAMSCLIWAKHRTLLAVGTAKGNVSIYDHNNSK